METKICTKCGRELPATAEYFHKSNKVKSGIRSDCKECSKKYRGDNNGRLVEYSKQHYEENKERISKQTKLYNNVNKEKISQRKQVYRQLNKVEIAKRDKQYYEDNKVELLEYHAKYRLNNKENINQWFADNKDGIRERNILWREQNKEHVSLYQKKYLKENRMRVISYSQNRNAKKKGLRYTLTVEQWEQIQKDFSYTCAYCGQNVKLEQEHFIPLSKGGEYTHDNIIPSCKSCNSSKGNKGFAEWYPKHKHYNESKEKFILGYLHYKNNVQQLTLVL